jgi:hypothetical protein
MSGLIALDWATLLDTPHTRWYLDDRPSFVLYYIYECEWTLDCLGIAVAFVEYQVCGLPGDDADDQRLDHGDLVCAAHLPDIITHATGEPLVLDTVVEIGVNPVYLRLTDVAPALVERFHPYAYGVGE